METACPHCTQTLELAPATLEALRGQPHFQCPVCAGAVPVPGDPEFSPNTDRMEFADAHPSTTTEVLCPHCSETLAIDAETWEALRAAPDFPCPACSGSISLAPEEAVAPAEIVPPAPVPRATARGAVAALARPQRGLDRNLILLGTLALLTLGGLGIFLASRKGTSTTTLQRNVKNEVTNNKFFTDLVVAGADLSPVTSLRPLGIGFVGMSKQAVTWEEALAIAGRTASRVLTIEPSDHAARRPALEAIAAAYPELLGSTSWVMEGGEPRVVDGMDVNRVTTLTRPRKALFHWRPAPEEKDRPSVRITSLNPRPGKINKVGNWIKVQIDYHNPGPGAVRIWAMPYKDGKGAANLMYAPSDTIAAGRGQLEKSFGFLGPSAIDEIHVNMVDAETKKTVASTLWPIEAGWEPDPNVIDVEILSVKPPATLSAAREITIPVTAGEKFTLGVTVRYKAPQPTKLAANLLLKEANILTPEFVRELEANHATTWHFDTESRAGYTSVNGEGQLSFDLIGYAPRTPGNATFTTNLGLFHKQTWGTQVLKLYRTTLAGGGPAAQSAAPPGVPIPGKPGFLTSPFAPAAGEIDVRGLPAGTEIKDPHSGKILRVP